MAQHAFQSDPCEALTIHGVLEHSGPVAQPGLAQPHTTRIERVFGDDYGVCLLCGARSEAFTRRNGEAEGWTCPVGAAEALVARNLDAFAFRVRQAQRDGYFAVIR